MTVQCNRAEHRVKVEWTTCVWQYDVVNFTIVEWLMKKLFANFSRINAGKLRLRWRFLVYQVQRTMCGHSWTTRRQIKRCTGQNIGQAPWAFDSMDMCAIKVYYINIHHHHVKQLLDRWKANWSTPKKIRYWASSNFFFFLKEFAMIFYCVYFLYEWEKYIPKESVNNLLPTKSRRTQKKKKKNIGIRILEFSLITVIKLSQCFTVLTNYLNRRITFQSGPTPCET
jgi:hypothetical protein